MLDKILVVSWGGAFEGIGVQSMVLRNDTIHEQLIAARRGKGVLPVLVLPGGADISTTLYGEDRIHADRPSPYRDMYEVFAYLSAKRLGIPVLGICRGHQLMAVVEGARLVQDIGAELGVYHEYYHEIVPTPVIPDTLAELIENQAMVNSLHHQSVLPGTLPAGAGQVAAYASDGVVEAIVYPHGLGVQWHPEMMVNEGGLRFLEWVANLNTSRNTSQQETP